MRTHWHVTAAVLLAAGLTAGRDNPAAQPVVAPAGALTPVPADGDSFTVSARVDTAQVPTARTGEAWTVPARRAGGDVIGLLALTPDGEAVVTSHPPLGKGADPALTPRTVGLVGRDGFRQIAARQPVGEVPRQVTDADTAGDTVAWVESPGTEAGSDGWRVYAHDGARTRLLGDDGDAKGSPADEMSEAPDPTVGNRTVFWAAAAGTGPSIVSRATDGSGRLRTVARQAKLPEAAGDDLFWVRSADVAPGFPADRYEIHRTPADGPDTVAASGRLTGGTRITDLVVAGDTVTWLTSPGRDADPDANGTLTVWNARTNDATVVLLHDEGYAGDVVAAPGRVVWFVGAASDPGGYLFDTASRVVQRLGSGENAGPPRAAGAHVAFKGGAAYTVGKVI
jgi:hypothetical protein